MDELQLRTLLQSVRDNTITIEDALSALRRLPFEVVGDFARLDHHRAVRRGFPEVILAQGKTPDQVVHIFRRLAERSNRVLATRVTAEMYAAIRESLPEATYHSLARLLYLDRSSNDARLEGVLVVSAGTADVPVAEEAAITAELTGSRVERLYDVGVAGLHRLLNHAEALQRARVIVVVAGMEGALASVVAGLVAAPVIAVPTSVGYGANFGGLSALLTMLNSCANGVAVVNIDNGFGAGYLAGVINRLGQPIATSA
ncbi:MAG: nickel pincer cofactor biosynthesis protein LarB [Anaerolineae bacterium]|nr:nickel pincer cofactor biosynthesis protein LarB [Thermoflexales bacterium]MDW8408953.1 nickel pincer cofactor biosynthesis protein LarB [Anaerolineae bacterium]